MSINKKSQIHVHRLAPLTCPARWLVAAGMHRAQYILRRGAGLLVEVLDHERMELASDINGRASHDSAAAALHPTQQQGVQNVPNPSDQLQQWRETYFSPKYMLMSQNGMRCGHDAMMAPVMSRLASTRVC